MVKSAVVYLTLSILILTGCSKYGFVNLNYPQRPAIILPEKVSTIALVNRSLTREEDKQKRIIESIATGEIAGSDRIASDECLRGVYDRMNGQQGINVVIPSKTRLYGTGTRETPELLDWKIVKTICDSMNADALLVLETFDSNSDIVLQTMANNVRNVVNGGNPTVSVPGSIRMNVVCFWRLYDPLNKTIFDQYRGTSYFTFDGGVAGLALPPPEALPNTAYAAGEEYILRFLPSYYTVKRDMYKKGKGSVKHEFKAGFRAAEVANWEGAIEKWEGVLKHSNRKTSGRACLNIAVAHEVLGDTESALKWVKKSYEDYNDKLARSYVKILLNRRNIE